MDGILIDTEPQYLKIGISLLKDEGVEITGQDFEKYVGTSSIQMWDELISVYNLNLKPEYFIEKSRKLVNDLLELNHSFPPLVPGILEFLNKFTQIPSGVASSTSLPLIKRCLEKAGIIDHFSSFTSGHEVKKSKPAPDVFLLASERLGYSPDRCFVIEDSRNGTLAAKEAGMHCIGLQNSNSGNQDLSLANKVVHNYQEAYEYLSLQLTIDN